MHDKPANKIENKTEEREEDTEKFYVAEEGVPLYICDQNALIAYYGSEIELNRTIVSPRGDGIYSARLPLLDVALPFFVYGRGLLFLDAYYLLAETVNNNTWRPITSVMIDIIKFYLREEHEILILFINTGRTVPVDYKHQICYSFC